MAEYPPDVYELLELIKTKSKGTAGLNVDEVPAHLETAKKIAIGQGLVFSRPFNNESLDEIGRELPDCTEDYDDGVPGPPEHLYLSSAGELALSKHRVT